MVLGSGNELHKTPRHRTKNKAESHVVQTETVVKSSHYHCNVSSDAGNCKPKNPSTCQCLTLNPKPLVLVMTFLWFFQLQQLLLDCRLFFS